MFNQPNQELVIQRLLRNPSDGARLFAPFYGEQIASRFESLIREHLVIAAELVVAAKNGESTKVSDARTRWYQNADDIARFMSEINPFWTYNEWLEMMNQHLKLVESEAVSLIQNDYQANIAVYDKLEE